MRKEAGPYEWQEYFVRARINPHKNTSRATPLNTEPERVRQYLTGYNSWTEIVEVEVEQVEQLHVDQKELL